LGVKKGKLQSEAVAKLQGELEKEGRAASSSVAMPQKAAAGATASKRSSSRKGRSLRHFSTLLLPNETLQCLELVMAL